MSEKEREGAQYQWSFFTGYGLKNLRLIAAESEQKGPRQWAKTISDFSKFSSSSGLSSGDTLLYVSLYQ